MTILSLDFSDAKESKIFGFFFRVDFGDTFVVIIFESGVDGMGVHGSMDTFCIDLFESAKVCCVTKLDGDLKVNGVVLSTESGGEPNPGGGKVFTPFMLLELVCIRSFVGCLSRVKG